MNALIFAAGLGTRLKDISENKPKALVEVANKPMLLYAIEKMVDIKVKRIVINVHHHANMIKDYVSSLSFPDTEICISDESDTLLETGGGLLFAKELFIPNEPIILYNVDIITSADLESMLTYHKETKALATLMVKERETSRYLLFNDKKQLAGWKNTVTGEYIYTRDCDDYTPLAFSGIHIVDYKILNKLGELRKFSITKGYLNISKEYPIQAWQSINDYWFDIGTPEKWSRANEYMLRKK